MTTTIRAPDTTANTVLANYADHADHAEAFLAVVALPSVIAEEWIGHWLPPGPAAA